eukprot:TRINITY_DN2474_c1_g1_i1.p1 TRINITY_DN2474_c1_g1~~TRINITY_DN2474_c1_g1_i1.p1  ORF type:complete len:127 (+),score=20.61 TRINITY_DN2474_c1_g1_i1:108-488(+)
MSNFINNLTITLVGGKNLKTTDIFFKSDPYCEIVRNSNAEKAKTHVINSTKNPQWHSSFNYKNVDRSESFTVTIYDYDSVGAHDFLGQVILNSAHFTNFIDRGFPLCGNANSSARGELYITMAVIP